MIETNDGNANAEQYGLYDTDNNICGGYGIGKLKKVIPKIDVGEEPDNSIPAHNGGNVEHDKKT
jgi:hypothetical protein